MTLPNTLPTPDDLLRLQALTRDYARLTRSGAGLGKVLGGAFLFGIAALECFGHGFRFTLAGALAPLPLAPVAAACALPFLWLAARTWLARWWYRRHGTVETTVPAPARARWAGVLLPGLMLLGLAPVLAWPVPPRGLRSVFLALLALGLALAWPRILRQGRMERMLAILLFLGPALLVSGIQMAAADTFLAFPVVGALAVVFGLREHLAYRRLARELA